MTQPSVGPELFFVFLWLLEDTGWFNASLYKPFTTGHTGFGVPIAVMPDRSDLPCSAARLSEAWQRNAMSGEAGLNEPPAGRQRDSHRQRVYHGCARCYRARLPGKRSELARANRGAGITAGISAG